MRKIAWITILYGVSVCTSYTASAENFSSMEDGECSVKSSNVSEQEMIHFLFCGLTNTISVRCANEEWSMVVGLEREVPGLSALIDYQFNYPDHVHTGEWRWRIIDRETLYTRKTKEITEFLRYLRYATSVYFIVPPVVRVVEITFDDEILDLVNEFERRCLIGD